MVFSLLLSSLSFICVSSRTYTGQVSVWKMGENRIASLELAGEKAVPRCLPTFFACGLDGCKLYAYVPVPDFDGLVPSKVEGSIGHVEFSLPGSRDFGVSAQTVEVDGKRFSAGSPWAVWGTLAAFHLAPFVILIPMAAWSLKRRTLGTPPV